MDRIVVVGTSGSGKSTLARQIGEQLALPVVELDSFRHMPGWQQRPDDEFIAMVRAAVETELWVVDGNYSIARDVIWSRAQMVIWLDYPRWRVMSRVIRRTIRRVVTREELWNGNREPWSNLWSINPEKSVIAWAWTTHGSRQVSYGDEMTDPSWSHIEFRRIGQPDQVDALLAELADQ